MICDLGATFGHPRATFGKPWVPFSDLVPTLGRGPGALGPFVGESIENCNNKKKGKWGPKVDTFSMIF